MKSLRKIIFTIIMSVTIITGLIFSICIINSRKSNFSKTEYDDVALCIYETVSGAISNPIYSSLTMAKNTFLIEALKNEADYSEDEIIALMANYLSLLKDTIGSQTAFVVSEKSHRYYYYDGLNKIIDPEIDEHDAWYTIFTNTRKPYDLDVDTDQVNKDSWTVFVNARIEDENKRLLGVCGIGISMKNLQTMLINYENRFNIKVNFINSEGVVQVDTDSVNIENAYLYDVQYGKEKDGYAYKNSNNEYVVMRYVDDLGWYLVIRGHLKSIDSSELIPLVLLFLGVILINLTAFFVLIKRK